MSKIKRTLLNVMNYDFIPFCGWISARRNKYCNIIYFHDIVEGKGYSLMKMPLPKFISMMDYLKSHNFETMRFDDFGNPDNLLFKPKRVLIAFDDGWLSNYTEIFEYMRQQDIHYNIFLTMGKIGNDADYLTWDMVREMHGSGICGFGVHTFSHADMTDLGRVDCDLEFFKSNELFNQQLGFEPQDFCFPFGWYSKDSLNTAADIYPRVYTSDNMFSYNLRDSVVFGRCGVGDEYPFRYFVRQAKGYFNISKDYWKVYIKIRGK